MRSVFNPSTPIFMKIGENKRTPMKYRQKANSIGPNFVPNNFTRTSLRANAIVPSVIHAIPRTFPGRFNHLAWERANNEVLRIIPVWTLLKSPWTVRCSITVGYQMERVNDYSNSLRWEHSYLDSACVPPLPLAYGRGMQCASFLG